MAEPRQIDVDGIERKIHRAISMRDLVDICHDLLAYIKQVDEARHQGVK